MGKSCVTHFGICFYQDNVKHLPSRQMHQFLKGLVPRRENIISRQGKGKSYMLSIFQKCIFVVCLLFSP